MKTAEEEEIDGLLARGDEFAAKGDPRAAVSFFQAALKRARQGRPVAADTLSRLQKAGVFIQARAKEFERALDRAIGDPGSEDPLGGLRLAHALDMVKGRREIYPQQPSMFYYPYLAQQQFFDAAEFGWASGVESATGEIRDELLSLLDDDADFRPYVEDDPDRPSRDFHGLNNNGAWTALYLWKHGTIVPEVAQRCPKTAAALEGVPLTRLGSRTPSVFFSRLEPGAHIPPHTGMLNSRLICHLPLIVPDGCWLRVGNETRQWEEGKLLVFDDSIEHEARNPSDQIRIILIFDIWRPELSPAERKGISGIFETIDEFQPAVRA